MGKGAIIIGVLSILLGLWMGLGMLAEGVSSFALIYPSFFILLGMGFIIMHKEEETIEKRKDKGGKKWK